MTAKLKHFCNNMRKTHESRPGLRNKHFNIPEKSTLKNIPNMKHFRLMAFPVSKTIHPVPTKLLGQRIFA